MNLQKHWKDGKFQECRNLNKMIFNGMSHLRNAGFFLLFFTKTTKVKRYGDSVFIL